MNEVISPQAIRVRIHEISKEIAACAEGKPVTLMPVMNGGMVFGTHLMEHLEVDHEVEVDLKPIHPTMIGGRKRWRTSGGWSADNHVVIVDDIYDSGRTYRHLRQKFGGFLGMQFVALLEKDVVRYEPMRGPDIIGFRVPDVWVWGFGMDNFHGFGRGLERIVCDAPLPAGYDPMYGLPERGERLGAHL